MRPRAAWFRAAALRRSASALGAAWILTTGAAWAQEPSWTRVAWQGGAGTPPGFTGGDYYGPTPPQNALPNNSLPGNSLPGATPLNQAPPPRLPDSSGAHRSPAAQPAMQGRPQYAPPLAPATTPTGSVLSAPAMQRPAMPSAAPVAQHGGPIFAPPPINDGHWPQHGMTPPGERLGHVWPSELPGDRCLGDYGCDNGWFARYDLLLFGASKPQDAQLGDPNSAHYVTANGLPLYLQNSLTLHWNEFEVGDAHRIEFGHVCGNHGWMANVLWGKQRQNIDATGVTMVFQDPDGYLQGFQDSDGDGIDDDVNNNHTYGRDGQDLGTASGTPPVYTPPFDGEIDQAAPTDLGDVVEFQVLFDTISARNELSLFGGEWMGVCRADWSSPCHGFDLFYGARYLDVEDIFGVTATGGELGDAAWAVEVNNHIVGPQIGGRWFFTRGCATLGIESRFLAGANFQRAELNGSLASNATAGQPNHPANLVPNSFSRVATTTEFSTMGELRLDAAFQAYDWLAFRAGYNVMLVSSVSRASGKVVYELPSFGLSDANSNDTLILGALTLGVEIRH